MVEEAKHIEELEAAIEEAECEAHEQFAHDLASISGGETPNYPPGPGYGHRPSTSNTWHPNWNDPLSPAAVTNTPNPGDTYTQEPSPSSNSDATGAIPPAFRNQEEVLDYLLTNFFTSTIEHKRTIIACLRPNDMFHPDTLCQATLDDYRDLTYIDSLNCEFKLSTIQCRMIFNFGQWYQFVHRTEHVRLDDWEWWHRQTQYDRTHFLSFQMDTRTPPPPGVTNRSTSQHTRDPVTIWLKTIKRDKLNYPVLKHEKDWDTFHRRMKIQLCADQLVDNMLDPNYHPSTMQEQKLDC